MPGCATQENFTKQGRQYASMGNWDMSVQAFQKALEKNPKDKEIEILLFRAKKNASLAHLAKGEALLRANRFDDAITEFQMSIAFDPTNIDMESLIEKATAMKESEYHFKRGENLLKAQKNVQAKEAFKKSLHLNPNNKEALQAIELVKKKERELPKYRLDLKKKDPISLKFKNTPILNVFEVLTRLTSINFIFDKDLQETKVTFFLTDVSFDEFIDIFLRTNKLAGKLVNEKTMIIYPDTPQKAKEYEDLQIRTFYLANMDVKKAVSLLAKILKSQNISANEGLNAIVIRGTKEVIEIASKIIEANDRPASEVMLNVEILEVKRSKERQIGLELDPTSATIGIGESTSGFFNASADDAPVIGSFSLNAVDGISDKNILFSIPSATINLLKRDGDTKTLASPQIRVKNKEKAKIHIGERIPLRSNRRMDANGAITYDYQYQDVGIKLNVEPTINLHDDISLKLTLEVSSIGENVGTTDDPQYSIRTRTAQSVMGVRAGESVVIGGLISDEERKTIRKVPLLGDVPILGYLFSNYETDDSQTDILMAITPIMIRGQEIPSPEVAQIWSGKEQDFSLREPYEGYYEENGELSVDTPNKPPMRPEGYSTPHETQASPSMQDKQSKLPKIEAKTPVDQVGQPKPVEPPQNKNISLPPTTKTQPESQESSALNKSTQNRPSVPKRETTHTRATTSRNKQAQKNPIHELLKSAEGLWPATLKYTIHVNSFINKDDADQRVFQLKQMKFDSFTYPGVIKGQDTVYYRVFVGKYDDFLKANAVCEELKLKRGFRKDIHVVNRSWAIGG